MSLVDNIIHPQSFLGLTDLRVGTIILALINFVLNAVNFGAGGDSWRYIVTLCLAILALVCTGLGAWGAFKNNAQHVKWYFYYCFINLIIAIVHLILCVISLAIWALIVNIIYLIIAVYTLCIVKSYLGQLGGGGAAGAV